MLNTINYQTLIATKASRIRHAAGEKVLLSEFGLRRAPSLGGIYSSRAAIIGGFDSTSNVLAAQLFDLKAVGTMAHSFIQRTGNELEAFRQFAKYNPEKCVLLVDTYDTLKSGLPNAITVAKELEKRGYRLAGIRLDSGDLEYLSHQARQILDKACLKYVKIIVSNQLDETLILSLRKNNAPIDLYGVGTSLVTGFPDAAIEGVYKLCSIDNIPQMKFSENLSKANYPGIKKVVRYSDISGNFVFDGILLEKECSKKNIKELFPELKASYSSELSFKELLSPVMIKGERVLPEQNIQDLSDYLRQSLQFFPDKYKTHENPSFYKIYPSKELKQLIKNITKRLAKG